MLLVFRFKRCGRVRNVIADPENFTKSSLHSGYALGKTWRLLSSLCFSKRRPSVLAGCALLATVVGNCLAFTSDAPSLTAHLRVAALAPAVVRIELELRPPAAHWTFRDSYGRLSGLAERIVNFSATDSLGKSAAISRIGNAEFRSAVPVSRFSYEVLISQPANWADASHVSWLNEQGGYLMLGDLLPMEIDSRQVNSEARVEFQLPAGWDIVSSVELNRTGQYQVPDPAAAVFLVSKDLRVKRKQIGRTEFLFATVGEWPFRGDSVIAAATRTIKDHARHVGFDLPQRAVLMLAPLFDKVGAERWTAETRGSNVVLVLGNSSAGEVLLARLSVVLTHELFHLWVPGALALTGDYAWFYEGFTLYQALRSAVRLGVIDWREFLSTMARVYDSYLATFDRDRLSLIEASQNRWLLPSSLVYDKGMLLAFLYDLSLRRASRNQRSLDDVYRELFSQQRAGKARDDGNDTLIRLLNQTAGGEQFTKRYISTAGAVALETELPAYGLVIESFAGRSQLQVSRTLSNEQRRLLESLGYGKKSSN